MEPGYKVGGRYKIIRELGEGGMSLVYLAHDLILNRDVTVKVLKYDSQNNPETTRRFHREAMAVSELDHPNIVDIYDIGDDHGMQYLVMEFVDGTNLKKYLRDNYPLSLERIQQIMQQILSAVDQAHSMGIIHRDLKPLNILVDRDGNIKISDFGIAMALSDDGMTQTNSVLGTVHYLSPEQARGFQATKQSDIYSLGIILYELLTGSVPFMGDTAVSIAVKHSRNAIPSVRAQNPNIPQSFENIITRATAKNLSDRYSSVQDMLEDMNTALDPDRINEPKLIIPNNDPETTKVIPHAVSLDSDDKMSKMPSSGILPKDDNNKTKKKRKLTKKEKILIALASAVGFIIFLFFIIVILGYKKDVKIPDVSNVNESQAAVMLKADHLTISKNVSRETNSDISAGNVIRTYPAAKTTVKEGATVQLIISTGPPTYVLGNYVSQNFSDARNSLEDHGIKVSIKRKYSNTVKSGIVIDQSIPANERVKKGTNIVLTVSRGEELVTMKDLRGFSQQGVSDFANENNLTQNSTTAASDDVAAGTVISQSPAANTKMKKGSSFNVVYSSGPKPKAPIPSSSSSSSESSSSSSSATSSSQNKNAPVSFSKNIIIPFHEPTKEDIANGANPNQNHIKIFIGDSQHKIDDVYSDLIIRKDTQVTLPFTVNNGQNAFYRITSDGKALMSDKVTP